MANTFTPVRINYSGSTPTGFAEYQTGETADFPGSWHYSGTGRRITGNMYAGAGSFADRLFFQSDAVSQQTLVSAMPSAGGTAAGFQAWNGVDLENSGRAALSITGASVMVEAGRTGTGTYLPLNLNTGGQTRVQISTSGDITLPTTGTKLLADWSSATSVCLTTTTVNGATYVPAVPNGTSQDAAWTVYQNNNRAGPWGSLYVTSTAVGLSSNSTTSTFVPLIFGAGGGERMRIDASSGAIHMACTTDPINALVAGTSVSLNNGIRGYMPATNTNGPMSLGRANAGFLVQFVKNGATQVGAITTDGTVTAYGTTSDRRMKQDIADADPDKAWSRLDAYRIRSLRYIAAPDKLIEFSGVADELQEANPDMVFGEKDAVAEYGILYAMRPVGDLYSIDGELVAAGIEEPHDLNGRWNPTGFAEVVRDSDCVVPVDELPGTRWVKTREQIIPQTVDWQRPVPELILNQQTAKAKIIALEERAAAQAARIEDLTEQLQQLLDRPSV